MTHEIMERVSLLSTMVDKPGIVVQKYPDGGIGVLAHGPFGFEVTLHKSSNLRAPIEDENAYAALENEAKTIVLHKDWPYPVAADFGPRQIVRAFWTGEKRPPKQGEWYLSGSFIEACRAPSDLSTPFAIAELVRGKLIFEREKKTDGGS